MKPRCWLSPLLVCLIATLFPLAYCDLPDQLWLGGYFDGGDEDDALFTIQLNLNAVQPPRIEVSSPVWIPVFVAEPLERFAPIRSLHSAQSRAPPSL